MQKLLKKKPQLTFGFIDAESKKPPVDLTISRLDHKVNILFRDTIPEIPSTTYGTFAIFKYPAKFIPQVIAYVLKEYAKPGMKIFDPFGGYMAQLA